MSAIKLNSSGGGSITISPASTASTLTLTAPAQTGTIGLDGPAFGAYTNVAGTLTGGTNTKALLATEEYDTANCYDISNSRFTPNVAGYYQFNALVVPNTLTSNFVCPILYKNGAIEKYGNVSIGGASAYPQGSMHSIIYMNGTTDFAELYVFCTVTATVLTGPSRTWWNAAMIRAA